MNAPENIFALAIQYSLSGYAAATLARYFTPAAK